MIVGARNLQDANLFGAIREGLVVEARPIVHATAPAKGGEARVA